jgi:hypothetical protein
MLMAAVKCGVDGCGRRLQPVLKVDPRDRSTWLYPECDLCGTFACDKHSSQIGEKLVCDRCRKMEAGEPLIQLGLGPSQGGR